MIAISKKKSRRTTKPDGDEQFTKMVPDIVRYARFAFRRLRPEAREEAISDVVTDALYAFRRLVELGKGDVAYATPLARFAVAHVRAGRRVGSGPCSHDVLSTFAQHRQGFAVERLCALTTSAVWNEILADDATPVPDQVAFRLDFRTWFSTLRCRDRNLVRFLAVGNTTGEAAQRFGVSRGRISQLRRELQVSWQAFQGKASQAARLVFAKSRTGGA